MPTLTSADDLPDLGGFFAGLPVDPRPPLLHAHCDAARLADRHRPEDWDALEEIQADRSIPRSLRLPLRIIVELLSDLLGAIP